jgi:hypothetical protein
MNITEKEMIKGIIGVFQHDEQVNDREFVDFLKTILSITELEENVRL